MTHYENLLVPNAPSPLLQAFLETRDYAAKTEWADDVELRLREVMSQIDPRPIVLGYAIERFGNSVAVFTVTRNELSKHKMAALVRGQRPCWDEIVKAVPKFIYSKTEFEACTNWEWWRKWDVEIEMSRFRFEDGIF